LSLGTPVARFIVIRGRVHFKAIEGATLAADPDFRQPRPHLPVEPVLVHAEVVRRVPKPDEAGKDRHGQLQKLASSCSNAGAAWGEGGNAVSGVFARKLK
jgi:hypothetical protein